MHCGSVHSVGSVACVKKLGNVRLFRQRRLRRPIRSRYANRRKYTVRASRSGCFLGDRWCRCPHPLELRSPLQSCVSFPSLGDHVRPLQVRPAAWRGPGQRATAAEPLCAGPGPGLLPGHVHRRDLPGLCLYIILFSIYTCSHSPCVSVEECCLARGLIVVVVDLRKPW